MFKVQHFDFPVSDETKAKHFYEHAFGWKVNEFDTPEGKYFILNTGSVGENGRGTEVNSIGGGFYKRKGPEDRAAVWLSVDDIDKVISVVTEHGGRVVEEKKQMGGMGAGAKIEDPDGNMIALWEETKKD